ERQLGMLRERSARDRTGLVGDVLVPLVEGIHAFAARDYRRAVERMEPLTPRIVELGGSRAQRDVFHDTLLEATFRAGDVQRAERFWPAGVARGPDRLGRARAAAGAAVSWGCAGCSPRCSSSSSSLPAAPCAAAPPRPTAISSG